LQEINRHYRTVKKALKRENLSGTFLGAKYRFSPYMACQHGCLYCDGRAEKYYVEGEFDRDIVIRANLPEMLQGELARLRERGIISIGSGVSDAYQPVESSEGLMRRCAEVLARQRFPVTVLTKSSLISRDIDLWSKINTQAGFMLVVSLVFTDDSLRKIFEPRAASVEQRLKILETFKARGCRTGVLAMPFIPLIADAEDHILRLFDRLAAIPVDFVMPGALTLRPGRQKETFFRLMAERYPEELEEMRALYAEERQSGVPLLKYRKELHRRFDGAQREFGIPSLVPHGYYQGRVHLYDEVNILLHHMVELYSCRGIGVESLRRALERYMSWLTERKRQYNRRRSWSYSELERELVGLIREERLESILGNRKLSVFLEDIVIDRKTLDYSTLKAE
jgi:DNA repair photolyase